MTEFAQIIPDSETSDFAQKVTDQALKELNLFPKRLRFFMPVQKAMQRGVWTYGRRFIAEDNIKGRCTHKVATGVKQIWIRADISEDDMKTTIRHELYHLYEITNGLPTSEAKAEDFGRGRGI
jgi:hypothetical protein